MTKIKLEYLNRISGGDVDFISEMLKTYIEETAKEILFLNEAFEQKNKEKVFFWAHKLKTSFHMLGLEELSEKTISLEQSVNSADSQFKDIEENFRFIMDNAEDSIRQAKKLIEAL